MKKVSQFAMKFVVTPSLLVALSACSDSGGGSGSGGDPTTATGQFKDSNTAGLSYVSGAQKGVTGTDGSFTYETGKIVTFSIGGVTLGSSNGKSIVTPVDLVADGSSSSTEVQNIVRFLMMLDDDGDSSNGINISKEVQTIAEHWSSVDFSTSDLETDLSRVISDVASVDSRTPVLPNATAAKDHLESTLLCSYAGGFKGTISGDDSGHFGVMVSATSGDITGIFYSSKHDQFDEIEGRTPITHDQTVAFTSGLVTTGASFGGRYSSVNGVSGTWENAGDSGRFSGSRIGGLTDAKYRFTGIYKGDSKGIASLDVSADGKVTGVAYGLDEDEDELVTLSGTLSGTHFNATGTNGVNLSGTLNTSTGVLNGAWVNGGFSGSFSGSGCQLN